MLLAPDSAFRYNRNIMEQTKKTKTEKQRERTLLWRFLRGSKGWFLISMVSAAAAALCDMVTPQIVRAAVDNEMCREFLSAHTYTTTSTPQHPDGIEISNWFLRRIEDKDTHGEVLYAKTGYVDQSGSCAASFQRSNSGTNYICVTVNAHSPWRCIYDHVEIYSSYTE